AKAGKTTSLRTERSSRHGWQRRQRPFQLYLVRTFASGTRCSSIAPYQPGTHGDEVLSGSAGVTAMPDAGIGDRPGAYPLSALTPVGRATRRHPRRSPLALQQGRSDRYATMTP